MNCRLCDQPSLVLFNGICTNCDPNPLRRCKSCDNGHYKCASLPNDMGRMKCNNCGHIQGRKIKIRQSQSVDK